VLLVGGLPSGPTETAELYDPTTGTFAATGSVRTAADFKTATLLPGGMVLVTGGRSSSGASTAEADLYDPTTGTFSATSDMILARAGHTATLLKNGKVLITGGAVVIGGAATTGAELYDPATGTFAMTGTMSQPRALHTSTLFANGKVLVAGGDAFFYNSSSTSQSSAVVEVYDPASETFSAAADMSSPRESQTATPLANGAILIAGGADGTIGYSPVTVLASSDLYVWH